MNILYTGLLAAGLAAAGIAGLQSPGGEPAMAQEALAGKVQRYRLLVTGGDAGCDIARVGSHGRDKAGIVLAGSCAAAPGFRELSYWLDLGDGSIALADADGEVRYSFAAADGAAYESYGAGVPLMALIAVRE